MHAQDAKMWLGYLEKFSDYLTQGETVTEPEDNLWDLYRDVNCDQIPGVRRIAELSVDHDWYGNSKTGISQPLPRHGKSKEPRETTIRKI
jgi:hypothetical protein